MTALGLDTTQARSSGAEPLLRLRGVSKHYGGVRALTGAHMTITGRGTVHGLIGENGSGKSTMLGILSGQITPDSGGIEIEGQAVLFASPVDAIAHGIAMVSQETALAPKLTVAENIFLGRRQSRNVLGIDWRDTNRRAREVLERLSLDVPPDALAGSLSPDRQQMVEIARAIEMDARLLVLDEPTSSLTNDEVESLFAAVRNLKQQGVSVVFVSHRLSEMFALTDEITVLRDGETVAEAPTATFTRESLVDAMVGDSGVGKEIGEPVGAADETRQPALEVVNLNIPGVLHEVSLEVCAGEIVGIAGLVGAGRSDLLEAIFGSRRIASGTISFHGTVANPKDPRAAIAAGVGYLPADRKVQGLALKRTIQENITMAAQATKGRLRAPSAAEEDRLVSDVMQSMRVRAPGPHVVVNTLSGGNQQKVALGKWIAAKSTVLLLDEPTRGVDVGAKADIHVLLRQAAQRGVALLISSSENTELLELCDRILVMFRGSVVASVPANEATLAVLGRYAGGHTEE